MLMDFRPPPRPWEEEEEDAVYGLEATPWVSALTPARLEEEACERRPHLVWLGFVWSRVREGAAFCLSYQMVGTSGAVVLDLLAVGSPTPGRWSG